MIKNQANNQIKDVPMDIGAIRWLMQLPQDSRKKMLLAITECGDQIQRVVFSQIEVIEDPQSNEAERERAYTTIRSALEVRPYQETLGFDIEEKEARAAVRDESSAATADKLDSQEADFHRRLKKVLSAKRIPQKELAKRLGMSQPAISQMLSRKCRPQRRTIIRIAKALDVDPRELWPDLEVADILDVSAAVQIDQAMSTEESAAIERAMQNKCANSPAKPLPKRKR